ncbi:hypothetical protein M501DRAFT_1016363 [Patellaria atrata CBS 101060]|uniref:White collar-2 n=1 Tax=Patellaria atrata CBS 101060 TaxID=1346257 RepID=A0A9P4SAU2_9PEZI|nr:hypothetical protein M501DRAFT_1016363 [Patellaria atrata CBS 101060]
MSYGIDTSAITMAGLPATGDLQPPILDGSLNDLGTLDMDIDFSQAEDPLSQPYPSDMSKQMLQQPSPAGSNDTSSVSQKNSGIGAGPLPTGFGMPSANNLGSTLTEFTKRRNWSQRVLEEIRDLLHILTPGGQILYVSPACKQLTGYEPQALVGQYIKDYIHPEDLGLYVREFNESIATGNPMRFFHRFKKPDGNYTIFESHGHPHYSGDIPRFPHDNGLNINPVLHACQGFFMMSRPFPTKSATLLDSFLEHKTENMRLLKKIADLKREEQEEQEEDNQTHFQDRSSLRDGITPDTRGSVSPNYDGMPPPAKPGISNTALTRQNLDEALAASQPDSINDKMARYEGATHIETIEMLTGLRYRDGERSMGISTGDTSPNLIRGDAGIAIFVDKDGRREGDKKKKLKVSDEYVCTDCGTLDSPEWRKGPNGPKTLCNACGLRWAKREKKRQGVHGSASGLVPSKLQHSNSNGS